MENNNSRIPRHLADEPIETPSVNIRYLTDLIERPVTPKRYSSNANARPSGSRSSLRTPTGGRQRAQSRLGPVAPSTPHALRALERRRAAALTPGRARRRSGLVQRETPRDSLRTLSKLLARSTKPIEPSPKAFESHIEEGPRLRIPEEFEEEADPPKPRVSLPLGEDEDDEDEDEPLPAPPQISSEFDDDNYTIHSIEQPRRAVNEQPFGRLSRASFGSLRLSDRFADLDDVSPGFTAMEDDGLDLFHLRSEEVLDSEPQNDDLQVAMADNSQNLRHSILGDTSMQARRSSDIAPAVMPDDHEASFAFDFGALPSEDFPFDNIEGSHTEETTADVLFAKKDDPNATGKPQSRPRQKAFKVSRHGMEYPSLPAPLVKRIASLFSRTNGAASQGRINKKALDAIACASDWFFEQISDDLGAYAKHAGRRTIDETDMVTLMKRQRQVNTNMTPFCLAQRHLPRELLQDIRMQPPKTQAKKVRRRPRAGVEKEEGEKEEETAGETH